MKYFDVFEHPVRGVQAIKHGFSWPAFFFHVWWALFHRAWLFALLLFALLAGVAVVALISTRESAILAWALLPLAVYVFAGLYGNEWRRVNVSKRGFSYVSTEQAETPDAATAQVMRKRQNDTRRI